MLLDLWTNFFRTDKVIQYKGSSLCLIQMCTLQLPLGSFVFVDSSKYKPFDQLVLRQKGSQGQIFPPGDGVCMMRFYYKMWGSLHMGQLQLFMVTKGNPYNTKSEVWKTRGMEKYCWCILFL